MDKFISEHLLNRDIIVYFDVDKMLTGKVIASADKVLTLIKDGKYVYININQVKYIQEK